MKFLLRRSLTSLCRKRMFFDTSMHFASFLGLATRTRLDTDTHRRKGALVNRLRSILDYQPLIFIQNLSALNRRSHGFLLMELREWTGRPPVITSSMAEDKEPLLDPLHGERFDYVLVFTNPYDPTRLPVGQSSATQLELTQAKDMLARIFRLSEASLKKPWVQSLLDQFNALSKGQSIEGHRFAEFVLKSLVLVMQQELHLEVRLFFSRDKDEVFCKVRASEQNLKIQADLIDYALQLAHRPDETRTYQTVPPFGSLEVTPKKSLLMKHVDKEVLFQHYNWKDEPAATGSLFQYKDRVRLIVSMLDSIFERSVLVQYGFLNSEICVNNEAIVAELEKDWTTLWHFWRRQDIPRIRSYFGEEVAMYFAWIEFYVQWLIVPGFVGLVAFLVVVGLEHEAYSTQGPKESNYTLLAFAMFLSISSTLFDVLWTRKESILAWKWGTSNLEVSQGQRSDFAGPWEEDPVTGKMRKRREPGGWPRARKFISFSVVILFVGLVLAAVVAIFLYRASLSKDSAMLQWTAFINALQIKVMGFIYSYVAKWMNDWENIEFQTEYDNALSIKLFMFQFVNSYTSLFYIAFVKSRAEGCIHDNCMQELSTQLTVIFITNLALNVLELGLPWVFRWMRNRSDLKKYERLKASNPGLVRPTSELTAIEQDSKRSKYETPLTDYMEIALQYGYVVMFCPAFPLAPLLAFGLSLLEVRVDAWKLCHLEQRPFPDQVKDVGVWSTIMRMLSIFAAITNPAIIIFTAGTFDDYPTNTHWIIFLALEHFLLGFQVVVRYLVADEPECVRLGLVWSERIMEERLLGHVTDIEQERANRDLHFSQFTKKEEEADFAPETIALDNV